MITSSDIYVLSFGYGRNFFDRTNRELERMRSCAQTLGALHMVIFTLQSEGFVPYTIGNLTLHPTNSKTRWLYCFDALRIGFTVLRDTSKQWVIATQDPFETGCVGLFVSWWRSVPLNVQEHGDFYSRPYWKTDQFSNRIRSIVGLFVLLRADTVRVVSERIAHALQNRGIEIEKIIRLPVRTDALDGEVSIGSDLRQLYPQASVIILTMGRLVTQKNLPLLIDAFARLVVTEPQAKLVIIGDGPLAPILKQRVVQSGILSQVAFIPWTDTPQSYMRTADIYALSSDWEGWARVLVEAMEAGIPVVTTDVGCVGEVLKDRVHGLVVPPRALDAFADALQEMVRDSSLRAEYGRNAQRAVGACHVTMAVYAQSLADLYVQTAQKKYV
ncbi:MAG: glycosyltransferase family 4 protein [Minisyncoccia bacterium]